VGQEAMRVLQTIPGPLCTISVCGRARQGKSFLLNQILSRFTSVDRPKGFVVSPTHQSCTRGIWIWSAPITMIGPDGRKVNTVGTRIAASCMQGVACCCGSCREQGAMYACRIVQQSNRKGLWLTHLLYADDYADSDGLRGSGCCGSGTAYATCMISMSCSHFYLIGATPKAAAEHSISTSTSARTLASDSCVVQA
jgi:hypothetical protein